MDYSTSAICRAIDEWIHNDRNRKILKRRYIDGVTYEKIAEEFELSVRQVKNIVYKSEFKIFKHLQ